MNIWDQLGLAPTNDTKAIKRAYAQKVKIIRPDEQPHPFQKLHSAYKKALKQARSSIAAHDEQRTARAQLNYAEQTSHRRDILTAVTEDHTEIDTTPPCNDYEPTNQDNPPSTQRYIHQKLVDQLSANVKVLLEDNSQRHILSSWEFLIETPHILDSTFNWQLGLQVFTQVAQYNQKNATKRRLIYRVDAHIANYLNDIFNWKSEERFLRSQLGDALCNYLMPLIVDRHQQTSDSRALAGLRGSKSVRQIRRVRKTPIEFYYFGGPIKRAIAMLVDIILIYPIAHLTFEANRRFIFQDINPAMLDQIFYATFISLYLLATWLFETSNLQATPGKMLFGLKVTDADHAKLGSLHGLWRSLSFGITSAGFYITIIINHWLGGNFIHDRLSKSYVIDYRRSEREHNRKR